MTAEDFQARTEKLLFETERLEHEARKAGGRGAASAMRVYSRLHGLVSDMREIEGKAAALDNADIATKLKFSRKAKKVGKEFWRIVREINALHAKGELEEKDAKQFGKALELIKSKKMAEAERELSPFKRLEALARDTAKVRSEMEALSEEVESRINYLQKELSSAVPLKKIDELEAYSKKYGQASRILEDYSGWRLAQIEKLKRMPAAKLITACISNADLFDLGFPKPKDEYSLSDLGEFLVSSKISGNAKEVLRLNDLGVEKLKPIVSDHHQFKRLASENARWLDAITSLEASDFLKFDFGNEKKKERIIFAIGLAKEKKLEEEIVELARTGRTEYEEWKAASARLLEIAPKKHLDESALNSEIAKLEEILGKLQPPGGE